MGKHAWATGRSPGAAYAARFSALAQGARAAGAPLRTAEPGATESGDECEVRPRIRWRLPAAASCLVLGVVLSVVLALVLSGGMGPPERTVTSVKTGGTDAAAMERTRLEATAAGGPAPSSAESAHPDQPAMRDGPGSVSGRSSEAGSAADSSGTELSTRSATGAQETAVVIVHIAGAVQVPGIVRLPAGSRVHAAVTAAGGAAPDAELSAVNLAARIEDGQQFHIPTTEEVASGNYPAPSTQSGLAGSGSGAAPGPGAEAGAEPAMVRVNVNSASTAELSKLPGVGPVLSQRIIEWRTAHGAFTTLEQLDAVAGIGPTMLQSLRGLVLF